MKKNISINLFGTLYAIDEDAYNLLENYLNSMKSYFSRQTGGDEIADDIEHRVAELLWQEKEAGAEAVNIDMIKNIIEKIGDPAQIDDTSADTPNDKGSSASNGASTDNTTNDTFSGFTSSTTDAPNSHPGADGQRSYEQTYNRNEGGAFNNIRDTIRGKRLYRDLSNKMMGGVCSGLSCYFGGDVTFWRLGVIGGAIVSFLLNGWFFHTLHLCILLGYFIMWFVIPVVRTPEDRLRMMGKDVNPQNINEEIINSSHNNSQASYAYGQPTNNNDGCAKTVGIGCLGIILIVFVIPSILSLIALAIGLPFFGGALNSGLFHNIFNSTPFAPLMDSTIHSLWQIQLVAIPCILIVIIIPLYFIIRVLSSNKKPLSTSITIMLIIIWLATVIFGMFFIGNRLGNLAGHGFKIFSTIPGASYHITVNDSTYTIDDDSFFDEEPFEEMEEQFEEAEDNINEAMDKIDEAIDKVDEALE